MGTIEFYKFAFDSLTDNQKQIVRNKWEMNIGKKKGATYNELMEKYNCSYSVVYKACNPVFLDYRKN